MDPMQSEAMSSALNRGEKEPGADWSLLPLELLRLIALNLTNVADYVRFRCVSASWRAAARPADFAPRLPWLLLHLDQHAAKVSFLNLSDNRVYTIPLPHARHTHVFGSPRGWLVMLGGEEETTVSLFNPITRATISIPALPFWSPSFIHRAILRLRRGSSRAREITLALKIYGKLVFYTLAIGVWKWKAMEVEVSDSTSEFAYHRGAFYFVNNYGRLTIYKADSQREVLLDDPSIGHHDEVHLVESSRDLLLIARRHYMKQFLVFRLGRSAGQPEWERVHGIVESVYFLSEKPLASSSSCVVSGCKGDLIHAVAGGYMAESNMGTASIATLHVSGVGEEHAAEPPYRWRALWEHWTDWKVRMDLMWFMPGLC